jgi:hypothetical protein
MTLFLPMITYLLSFPYNPKIPAQILFLISFPVKTYFFKFYLSLSSINFVIFFSGIL